MPFIEPPVALDGNPHQVHLVQRDPQSAYRALQHGCEGHVEVISLLLQCTAGLRGLFSALLRKVNICPAGKEVFLIPNTFSMTKQNDFIHFDTLFLKLESSFFVDDSLQLYEISALQFACRPIILHPPLLAIVLHSFRDRRGKQVPAADRWLAARHFADLLNSEPGIAKGDDGRGFARADRGQVSRNQNAT